jgi:uncharacterized protein (TIGR02145 family)
MCKLINILKRFKSIYLLIILFVSCLTQTVFSQLPTYLPSDSLVGWWPFNGNANDESGNGNNGLVNGASLTEDRFGNSGEAYRFDGLTSVIEILDAPTLSLLENFSIGSWFQYDSLNINLGQISSIVNKHEVGNDQSGYTFGLWQSSTSGNGLINFSAPPHFDALTYPSEPQGVVQPNQWYQAVVTYDDNSDVLSYYLNGILIDTIALSLIIDDNNYNLIFGSSVYMGNNSPNWNYFNGKLDDIGIWNRVLSPTEVYNLYQANCTLSATIQSPPAVTGCEGDTVSLTAHANSSCQYQWYKDGQILPSATGSTLLASGSGWYTVKAISGFCESKDSVQIIQFPLPQVSAGPDQSACVGEIVTLNATGLGGNGTYLSGNGIVDNDGNTYQSVIINEGEWMVENLRSTTYSNGDSISNVTDQINWQSLNTGAYALYNNDTLNLNNYGHLYNWYAVSDSRNICPTGWHVPSHDEWTALTDYLGGSNIAGGKMKNTGIQYWMTPNTGATNESGFNAIPGGYRDNASFGMFGIQGYWWSSSEYDTGSATYRYLNNESGSVFGPINDKRDGFSVRCMKNLQSSGSTGYFWSPSITLLDSTGSTVSAAPSETTIFTLIGYNSNGCASVDSVQITLSDLSVVNAGPDQTVCAGSSVILAGSGATTYSWNNGVQDGIAFVPNGNMSYVLTGADSNGCIGTDTVSVSSLGSNAYIELYSNSDGGLCNGMAITQTNYSSNFTVIWSNGRTVTTTEAQDSCSNLCPGPFSVSITDNVNQCSFSLSGVIQNTLSVTDPLAGYLNLANADGNAPCSGEANIIAYGGVPPYQYQFMDVNGIISGSSNNADSLCPGVYTFKIFDSQQDSLNISFLICDSSSIFSIVDPDYQDSLIVDTLIVSVMENCDIDFASVDSVWISSYSYLGTDSLVVSWNVQDSAGIHEILNYYNISNCQGVFNLELSIFCPQKSLDNPYLKAYDQLYINAQTASINSPIQEVFKVWPNPFTNELFVELTSNELTDYFIMDAFGRVVVKGTLSPAEHQLDLHNLMSGIYFLCVGQKKIKVEKLLTSQH